MEQHKAAVSAIAATVRHFYDRKEAFRIFHGSTNSTRPLSIQRNGYVDTSGLNHVIKVDGEARTVIVEPNVPMDELVKATLRYGLIPPVVMEFPGITVGGGFAGTSGESSSFKYGFFDQIVNWIEIVLANGDVVIASETEKADVFRAAAGSFGTLGVNTLLELRLIEARKYVELSYIPVSSVSESIQALERAMQDMSVDYVDGIMFALNSGAIITGKLTDMPPANLRTQTFVKSHDPWYYLHVQKVITESRTPTTEVVPLTDYLFRYDRGAFWTGVFAFRYFRLPFNRFTRWALDYFLHTRVMYHALHESGLMEQFIIQDLVLPKTKVEPFINYVDEKFKIYPLWLCPLKKIDGVTSFHPHSKDEMPINVGVWGLGPRGTANCVEANKQLERKLRDLSGMKWLYAQVFNTEDEFWTMYDRKWYEAIRQKYHATSLPSVYQKVRTTVDEKVGLKRSFLRFWPFGGLYGVYRTIVGREYLLVRKRSYTLSGIILGLLVALIAFILW